MNEDSYIVSVVVCSYYSEKKKLISTLKSILQQKECRFEIVITDDGSQMPYKDEIESLFREYNFLDYKIIINEKNEGTVKNALTGVTNTSGKYVKLISPGDEIYGEYTLQKWCEYLDESKKRWSFARAVYYHYEDGKRVIQKEQLHPLFLHPYLSNQEDIIRKNYIIFADGVLGACTLVEHKLILQYLEMIAGRIKYAEDMMYRLMIWDDNLPAYYPFQTILYEYGTGISTGKNIKWIRTIQKEWDKTNSMLLERQIKFEYQSQMIKYIKLCSIFPKLAIVVRLIWRTIKSI